MKIVLSVLPCRVYGILLAQDNHFVDVSNTGVTDLPRPRCTQRGLAYVARHNASGAQYVGETGRTAKKRFAEHMKPVTAAQIASAKTKKKGEHGCSAVSAYCTEKQDGNYDVSFGVLGIGKNCAHRLAIETNGIEVLKPEMNRMHDGVNIG